MIKAMFFDFDGVIIDSTQVKTDAFYDLFLEFGENNALSARSYHLENQGVDRFKKLQHVFTNILHVDYSIEIQKEYSDRFSNMIFEKIIKCDFLPGIIEFLEILRKKSVKCFLLSATPNDELHKICFIKKIDIYFDKICGSPRSKVDHGKSIFSQFLFYNHEVNFFGDSSSDLYASDELGTKFVGVTYRNKSLFSQNINTILDFTSNNVKQFLV